MTLFLVVYLDPVRSPDNSSQILRQVYAARLGGQGVAEIREQQTTEEIVVADQVSEHFL